MQSFPRQIGTMRLEKRIALTPALSPTEREHRRLVRKTNHTLAHKTPRLSPLASRMKSDTLVPASGELLILNSPPISSRRCWMLRNPFPPGPPESSGPGGRCWARSNPCPLSQTTIPKRGGVTTTEILTREAPECLRTLLRD